jgi:hypothetical protein
VKVIESLDQSTPLQNSPSYVLCLLTVLVPSWVKSQDALGVSLPNGFTGNSAPGPSFYNDGFDLTGIRGNLNLNASYNSNVNNGQAGGVVAGPERDDVVVSAALGLNYARENRDWSLGANLNASTNTFLSETEFNAVNYSLGGNGSYTGPSYNLAFNANYASQEGVNRLNAQFIEQSNYSLGLNLGYSLSPLTSLQFSWGHNGTITQTDGFNDVSGNNFNLAAQWQATPLISIAPGVRYSVSTGNGGVGAVPGAGGFGDFTMIGPSISVNYLVEQTISLQSTVSYNFSEAPSGVESTQSNWSLSLNYQRELWGMNLGMVRGTQANFLQGGGFDLTTSYNVGYNRQLGFMNGNFGLNAGYITRDAEDGGILVGNARNSDFVNVGATLSFPILAERANFNLNASWRKQIADDDDLSFDAFTIGTGLSWAF